MDILKAMERFCGQNEAFVSLVGLRGFRQTARTWKEGVPSPLNLLFSPRLSRGHHAKNTFNTAETLAIWALREINLLLSP